MANEPSDKHPSEPMPLPDEVWVVCCQTVEGKMSSDYVADYREAAMEHAGDASAMPGAEIFRPYRVGRYINEHVVGNMVAAARSAPSADSQRIAELERDLIEERSKVKHLQELFASASASLQRMENEAEDRQITSSVAPTEQFLRTTEPRECPVCWGNGYTAGDSETDKVPCGICAETGRVLPYTVSHGPESLPADILAVCKLRGWNLHWTHRGVYLHLEASELIEALRGKGGDPLHEAADVLLVLMSITENAGLPWDDVLAKAREICEQKRVQPRYHGEEHDGKPIASARPATDHHCQNGTADICLASRADGVVCPDDSCDIDDGIRK